jgi:alanine racemase
MYHAQLEISRKRLLHNLDFFRSKLNPDTKILANLKANAYGLGAIEVGRILQDQVDYFSVAFIHEAFELRQNNIHTDIIVFNPSLHEFQALIDYRLEPEIDSIHYLKKLLEFLEKSKLKSFPVHIKLDTGLHRAGIMPNEMDELIQLLKDQSAVEVKSVYSHLAAAEDPTEDLFTQQQILLFEQLVNSMEVHLQKTFIKHILNSSGVFRFTENQYDMVRLGLGLFGYIMIPETASYLKPVAELKTYIHQIKQINKGDTVGYNRNFTAAKKTEVALLSIGYADGFNRLLSQGKWQVKCKGKTAPVIGNISMDTVSIDVTGLNCQSGDEVIVFDRQQDVYLMAKQLQTIPYEILTGISQRVKRIVV